jgi:type I restriction enzyme S subunit
MGQSPDGESYNTAGDGVPLINGPVEFSQDPFGKTIRSKFTTHPTKLCREGDLILCVRGSTTGRMNIAGFNACIGRGVAAIRARDYQPWINYFISSQRDTIHDMGAGATFPNVSGAMLADLKLISPPLAEQRRIVAILDEAFERIAVAKANAELNLQNARAVFEAHLRTVFAQPPAKPGETAIDWASDSLEPQPDGPDLGLKQFAETQGEVTRTGGREATTRHIPGPLSLSVGLPRRGAQPEWRWTTLSRIARLESGHTPSRQHPEYWSGEIPWLTLQDARDHHGRRIMDTAEHTNALGIANSSARLLPMNTVCLSRTASVGYVVTMGRPMATSQDFVNWVCSRNLLPDFLKYLLLAEGRQGFLRYSSGAVHQTVYFPEVKAFAICHPSVDEQERIVRKCDALRGEAEELQTKYEGKVVALDKLKRSLLHQAFAGQLTP